MQILSDNTVDTAGVLLNAHTPQVGVAYTLNPASAGTAGISNANRVRAITSGIAVYYAANVPASADHQTQVDLYIASIAANAGINGPAIRIDTAVDTDYCAGYRASVLMWALRKNVAGTATYLGTSAATLTVGNTYTLLLTAVGSSLTLWVNGVSTITATDSTITATGRVGIRISAGSANNTTSHHITNIVGDDGAILVPRLVDRRTNRRYVRN